MLAAYGCGWFPSLEACAELFVKHDQQYQPNPAAVETYKGLFRLYQQVYANTRSLNENLVAYR
jgi:xylulokinase